MRQKIHEITGRTGQNCRPSDFYAAYACGILWLENFVLALHSNILQSKVDTFWAMVFRHRFARISE